MGILADALKWRLTSAMEEAILALDDPVQDPIQILCRDHQCLQRTIIHRLARIDRFDETRLLESHVEGYQPTARILVRIRT